jgi:hypothetical protein
MLPGTYKLRFLQQVTSITTGINIHFGTTTRVAATTNGVVEMEFRYVGGSRLDFNADLFTGTITNVSIREIL